MARPIAIVAAVSALATASGEPRLASSRGSPLKLYLYADPAIDNSGLHDTADVAGDMLVSAQGNVAMAIASSAGFGEKTCGFVDVSDGVADLRTAALVTQLRF